MLQVYLHLKASIRIEDLNLDPPIFEYALNMQLIGIV